MTAHFARVLPALAVAALTATAGAQNVTFKMIERALSANDMSPDGRWVVGESDINGDGWADGTYRLDAVTEQMTILPILGLSAVAVSDDGTVVLGDIPDPEGIGSNVAAIWTHATGWYELSADGSVAVGLSWDGCSGRGFIWTAETSMLELEPLANGNNRASVVSADGTLIGGFAQGSFSRTPAIWDDTTAGQLLDPPAGDAIGEVHGINDDGTVLLGTWLTTENAARAVKWTYPGLVREMLGDGSLLPGWQGIPMDIADNGTIVGFDILLTSRRAWLRPRGIGPLVELESFIEAHGGVVPPGLVLEVCQAISTDGRYVVGHGFGTGAWRVTIDWPCVGDLNDDDFVDVQDFLLLLANWGADGPGADIAEPFDEVNVSDFLGLLAAWGPCP
ncbi:MAG: hypothetical protein ACYTAU_09910 [Planctomycetota bacterium]|jgi:uncharacterized membrane protein